MKYAGLLIILLLFLSENLTGQICQGNLGINIFEEGDFGSGNLNVFPDDPGIAPGYTYQTNPPPNDGYYSIANNTSYWGSFANTYWVNVGDNSPDSRGYMMVVNASHNPGLFYSQKVEGLCENTLYVFSADVINLMKPGSNGKKPDVSFLLNNALQYTTGGIAESGKWETYGFTFTTDPGQTSITLALRNNAPGGFGNDLAIDNITFRACGDEAYILPETIANICEDGEPIELQATVIGDLYDTPHYQWQRSFDEGYTWIDIIGANGLLYKHTELSGGFYYYRFLIANGPANLLNEYCRIVSNVKIVHVVPKFYSIIDTLCQGLSFELGEQMLDEAGTYTDSLLTSIGCDSIVTLHLSIIPDENIHADFELNDPSCDYLSDGSVEIEELFNSSAPIEIFIDGNINAAGQTTHRAEGMVHYYIRDRFGCDLDTLLTLVNPPKFEVDMGEDLEIELGELVQVFPWYSELAGKVYWQPYNEIICIADCMNAEWLPIESAWLSMKVYSEKNNCFAEDSIYVRVNESRRLFFPNAFSPNNDGINDTFYPIAHEPNVQLIEDFYIYDRWGNKVFEKHHFLPNDEVNAWDGNFRGVPAKSGVYVYLARVLFLDGKLLEFGGDVTLLR